VTGPNRVLPTSGGARPTGGFPVLKLIKVVTVQRVAEAGAPGARRGGRSALKGVLFDFNGVLIDDEVYHWRACREVMAPFGVRLTRPLYDARYLAFDDRTALSAMLADAGRTVAGLSRLVARKRAIFRRLTAARVRIEEPTIELVRALAREVPLAIVSGAPRSEILAALRQARLSGSFRAIIASGDVRRCKPDPEGYRLGLRRLRLKSGARAVAVEDSPGGIRAARRAGLGVLGIATSYAPAALRAAGAFRVIPDLAAIRSAEFLEDAASVVSRPGARGPAEDPG
jgi:HAD superfamily hydrolase (TIGR01509 family)